MPSPEEIKRRNQANQQKAAEEQLYQEWLKEANKYDGSRPITVKAGAGPIADAVVKRFQAEGWTVKNTVTGCRGLDEWQLSG